VAGAWAVGGAVAEAGQGAAAAAEVEAGTWRQMWTGAETGARTITEGGGDIDEDGYGAGTVTAPGMRTQR